MMMSYNLTLSRLRAQIDNGGGDSPVVRERAARRGTISATSPVAIARRRVKEEEEDEDRSDVSDAVMLITRG